MPAFVPSFWPPEKSNPALQSERRPEARMNKLRKQSAPQALKLKVRFKMTPMLDGNQNQPKTGYLRVAFRDSQVTSKNLQFSLRDAA